MAILFVLFHFEFQRTSSHEFKSFIEIENKRIADITYSGNCIIMKHIADSNTWANKLRMIEPLLRNVYIFFNIHELNISYQYYSYVYSKRILRLFQLFLLCLCLIQMIVVNVGSIIKM